ncbi:protein DA1 [Dactylosporangium sp. NBC_01737]|uniref:protein DA1 n=1 Tax=Dactylosporangium sp. NBC_01737 TaxID=2975959 RepID=UPI002E119111|nr:protein DA1 [Dactylosporangium sp. NBC_01737]
MDTVVAAPVCTVCGRRPVTAYRLSLRGEVTCAEHPVRAECMFCARTHDDPAPPGWRPFTAGMMRCPRCLVDAVETQREARLHLPSVRRQMTEIGLELPERVRVRIVSPQEAEAVAGPLATGVLLGLTEQLIGGEEGTRVTGISIVAGMPPTYFGRAVAHEIGHAWLALRGRAPVDDVVEEGVCELFAYAWLRRRGTPMALQLRSRLGANPDPVYGGGFRMVHQAVQRHGIATVLDRLLTTGGLR